MAMAEAELAEHPVMEDEAVGNEGSEAMAMAEGPPRRMRATAKAAVFPVAAVGSKPVTLAEAFVTFGLPATLHCGLLAMTGADEEDDLEAVGNIFFCGFVASLDHTASSDDIP